MEFKNGGLEDDFPFQFKGDFLGSVLIFRAVHVFGPRPSFPYLW